MLVSILTGLERPVQPYEAAEKMGMTRVSILTGLERPVQRRRDIPQYGGFVVSILTGLERPVQLLPNGKTRSFTRFQSSPALKDRCNPPGPQNEWTLVEAFQSSPALKDRCNGLRRPGGQVLCLGFNPHRP